MVEKLKRELHPNFDTSSEELRRAGVELQDAKNALDRVTFPV